MLQPKKDYIFSIVGKARFQKAITIMEKEGVEVPESLKKKFKDAAKIKRGKKKLSKIEFEDYWRILYGFDDENGNHQDGCVMDLLNLVE